jgi:ATP-independent RNA helicase DbpA
VAHDIKKMGRPYEGLQVLSVIGGVPGREQAQALENGVHIVVATPGRLVDHMDRQQIDFKHISYVVLDEADKMLEMGFEKEIQFIMINLPKKRQTLFFSATFPQSIVHLSQKYQNKPVHISIEDSNLAKPQIEEFVYECDKVRDPSEILKNKINTLLRVLQQHSLGSTVIFCNQKITVTEIEEVLKQNQVSCAVISGDLEQKDRDRVITLFRNGSLRILIATDVAARGLDIEHISLVINFDLPYQPEVYIHRIGRTGRAGRTGIAVSLMNPGEDLKIGSIEKFTGRVMTRGKLGFKNQHGLNSSFQTATMQTLHISGGKKDKLRPGDILGSLTGQPDPIEAIHIGKIDIQDRFSFVAIASEQSQQALNKLQTGKIKGHKYQIKLI